MKLEVCMDNSLSYIKLKNRTIKQELRIIQFKSFLTFSKRYNKFTDVQRRIRLRQINELIKLNCSTESKDDIITYHVII